MALTRRALLERLGAVGGASAVFLGMEALGLAWSTPAGAAIKVTALSEDLESFELHARRFLSHTTLAAVHWVNITRDLVTFKTLNREDCQQHGREAHQAPVAASSCH